MLRMTVIMIMIMIRIMIQVVEGCHCRHLRRSIVMVMRMEDKTMMMRVGMMIIQVSTCRRC